MQSDGSGLKEIIRGQQPFLARSGTWISYTLQANIPDGSGNPFNRQIWRINTDGTGKQQLTHLGDSDYPDANASSISPDEKLVAFFSGKESSDNPQQTVFDFGYRNVAIVPATGGARTTLTLCKPVTTPAELDVATHASGTCIAADNPAWTPDGKWLLVDTGWADGGGTYMVDINGQNFQQFYPENRGIVRVPLKSF